ERIFGYSRGEVIGHDLDVILGPRCSENHRRAVSRYLETRNPRLIGHETDFVAFRKNGESFPASISFSVAAIDGKLFFTGILRDMTETRQLEERIQRSERLAALGQVVAEISHEIRNPLALIGGFSRQLARTAQDEKTRSKLDIITQEVGRLENLLGELRDLYAPMRLVIEKIDLNELLREISSLAHESCRKKGIRLSLDTEDGPVFVEGDRGRLKQALLNLVKNGMEAMKKGGTLLMRSRVSGDRAELAISDEGPGIPEGAKEKIFNPFFTTKKQGTGLGLSVTKRIIEDHPGYSFTLASQRGRGTTVRITMGISKREGES
ncbi:MAG: PAS domain S-box protein, partial [Deltaproteobacteria bacterium]|nr:PAS domain S-box protein [Deltaproteobacteria bacterium]